MANNLPFEKKALVISALCEGASIRGIERMTGVNRNTIMSLSVRVGDACEKILDEKMHDLNCKRIEVDEIWGFVAKKRSQLRLYEDFKGFGDVWTYVALDPDSKLIPAYHVGLRTQYDSRVFMEKLSVRLKNQIQLSSDSLATYPDAVKRSFGDSVDYGQIVKTFSFVNLAKNAAGRYSPAEVVAVEKKQIFGSPDMALVSTSHVEKQNHTIRMHCRRLSRLTNAFSKRLKNFRAAIALHFAYYNLVKTNIAVRATPAQAAGVEQSAWTVAELVERCGE